MVNLREVPGEFAFTMNRPKNIIWLFCLISRFRLIRFRTILDLTPFQTFHVYNLFDISCCFPQAFLGISRLLSLIVPISRNFIFCFICSIWHFFVNCYAVPKGLCRVSFVYRHVGKLWNYFRDSVCLFKEEA